MAKLLEELVDIRCWCCHDGLMLVVVVLAIQGPKCIYGVVDVCVLRRRGAMEIIFCVRVENGPPSRGVEVEVFLLLFLALV